MTPDISDKVDSQKSEQSLADEIASLDQELTRLKTSIRSKDDQLNLLSNALGQKRKDYNSLFMQFPLGMQEEDYSGVKNFIDKLRDKGVVDLKKYFQVNPDRVKKLAMLTKITNVNQAMLNLIGCDSQQQYLDLEADIDDWWNEEWFAYYAAEFEGLASPDRLCEREGEDRRLGGAIFQVHMITTIVSGYEDSWKKVFTVFEDISERKSNEKALIEAKSVAEQANRAKSEFLSSMSHELRTPLNAMLGFTEIIGHDIGFGKKHESSLDEINRAGQHLLSLIDEILDLSRIEAGEVEISIEPVVVTAVIEDSLTWIADMANSSEISIAFDPAACDRLLVLADATKLKQVLLNLLTNAVKYNRKQGQVEVIIEESSDGFLKIGIRDTGPGISEDNLNQLFQPFNRLGAQFGDVEGTGIGLVITRQLLDLMQGRLKVDSTPGRGSTFWIELLRVEIEESEDFENQADSEASKEPTLTISAIKPKILVAEDNPVNRKLILAQMTHLGYQADFAENGLEALKSWQNGKYNLLMTDIRMPIMDGYELISQVRAIESGGSKASPIIVISANAMGEDVGRCFELGANDVLSKPLKSEELRKALIKWSFQQAPTNSRSIPSSVKSDNEVIDFSVLSNSVGDNENTHRQLLSAYLDELPQSLIPIQKAFTERDFQLLNEHTHRLKSSTGAIGANRLADLCGKIETASKHSDWDTIESCMPDFLSLSRQVESFARAFCANVPGDEFMAINENKPSKSNLSILLVDDDPVMHRVCTMILNDLSIYDVQEAISGSKALEIIDQRSRIDVVIFDLNMPEMDGIEFIRHLASQSFSGSLILTSGEDMRILKTVEKLAMEHELTMLGVLEKPVTAVQLKKILNMLDQDSLDGTIVTTGVYESSDLLFAINEDQLDVYFQPKVDVKTGLVVGAEALARWIHPSQGIINPASFITLAEENQLILKLTEVVFRKTLGYAAKLKSFNFNLNIALNISVDSLKDLSWPDNIEQQIKSAGLEPSTITIEITESRLMEDIAVALDILGRLSLKRFNLSIDDFGTGYSSLEQLQRIPFSELKIDRAFVQGASADSSARAILESSVQLARKLKMKIVAEGVETRQDWDLVAELGCDQVQGYFIARPMPIDQFLNWLGEWNIADHLR